MKVILVALVMLVFPAPVMAQETGMLAAQAGDNRPVTRGDLYRLDGKIHRLEGKFDRLEGKFDALGGNIDTLDAKFDALDRKMDALEERIDALTRVVWVTVGLAVVLLVIIITLTYLGGRALARN